MTELADEIKRKEAVKERMKELVDAEVDVLESAQVKQSLVFDADGEVIATDVVIDIKRKDSISAPTHKIRIYDGVLATTGSKENNNLSKIPVFDTEQSQFGLRQLEKNPEGDSTGLYMSRDSKDLIISLRE